VSSIADEVATLPSELTVKDAAAFFGDVEHAHRSYPVVDIAGVLVGMVERADALRWRNTASEEGQTLYDVISDASVPVAHPEDTVGRVTDLMIAADIGRVPVVEPGSGKLVGLIARKDLLRLRSAVAVEERRRESFLGLGRSKIVGPVSAANDAGSS
jgi:CIC family chloride channel protein